MFRFKIILLFFLFSATLHILDARGQAKTIDPMQSQPIDIDKESLIFPVPDSLKNYYSSGGVFCLIIVDVNLTIVDLVIEGVNIITKGENIVYSSPINKDVEALIEYRDKGFPNVVYPPNVQYLYQYIWDNRDVVIISSDKASASDFPIIWTIPIRFALKNTD